MSRPSGLQSLSVAFFNYRTWCLMIVYAFSFGVELTIVNLIAEYLFDQFDLDLNIAGLLGSLFGLMNLFLL